LAHQMGRLARALQDMPTGAVAADPAWRTPEALRRAAGGWLELLVADEHLVREQRDSIRASIERVCGSSWSALPTHGDFVPANVLMHRGKIAILLDVTGLALRHPDVDGSWWNLVVRFHHPAEASRLARSFRRGFGAMHGGKPEGSNDVAAVRALQVAAAHGRATRGHAVTLLSSAIG